MIEQENEFISVYMTFDNILTRDECCVLLNGAMLHGIEARVEYIIREINKHYYKFELSQLSEPSLIEFKKGKGSEWQIDLNGSPERKISFILFLSDPSEYKKGEVIFSLTRDIPDIKQNQGTLLLFPSFRPYKIKEVENGKMTVLSGWMYGSPFR